MAKKKEYDSGSITVLKGLEAVRKRPSMYIGDVGMKGLHHLIYEVVDNSIDEAMAGFCSKIIIEINKNGSVTISDNGRGIPVDLHKGEKKSALEVVMTVLHAGGKFDKDTYKMSGGLHGVGISVVNALSSLLTVKVKRDGNIYTQTYERGKPTTEVTKGSKTNTTGTEVTFYPDTQIFQDIIFQYDILAKRFKELAYLNNGIEIEFADLRDDRREVFKYEGGLSEFVKYLNKHTPIHKEPIAFSKTQDGVPIDVALQYNSSYDELLVTYVNNIHTIEGGTHLTGFKAALTRTFNAYIEKHNLLKREKIELTAEDMREGLIAIISVKVSEPQFEGQTKGKLGNSEVRTAVEQFVNEKLGEYFEENPHVVKLIIQKCIIAARSREAAKKARDLTRRKTITGQVMMSTKLADCTSEDVAISELYLVEGDSAGGSAKQGRNREFQAILPLKGKILNVEKSTMGKMLDNDEVKSLIQVIGGGIEPNFELQNVRYGKIIIMTDADVDGSHIRTLILTFLFKFMPQLFVEGRVYAAMPPLFRVANKNKKVVYCYDEKERDIAIAGFGGSSNVYVQRYKGLGEMNPEQLWETTMDPEKRCLKQINLSDCCTANQIFGVLMGKHVEPRQQFIFENGKYATNIDT